MPVRVMSDVLAIEETPLEARGLAPSTLAILQNSAARFPEKVAIRFLATGSVDERPRDVIYRELLRRVIQAANLFRELGVGPKDSVSMLLPMTPEAFVALIGAQTAGMANPINLLLEPKQIATLLAEARCRVLVAPDPDLLPGFWPKVEATLREMPTPPRVLRVGGPRERPELDALSFEAELEAQPGDALSFSRDIGPEDVAALFHTGGTTALPKLARHTHGGLALHSFAMATMLGSRSDDIVFNGLPIFHVGGATCAGLTPLSLGATILLATPTGLRNPNVVRSIWALVERFRITLLGMVPTSWGALLNVPHEGFDLSSLRLLNSGASAMPVEVAEGIRRKLGLPIFEGWGMTELHGFAAHNPAAGPCRIASVGLRMPYTDLVVAGVDDGCVSAIAAPGEIGHVLVRGPMLFGGYQNGAHNHGAWVEPEVEGEAKWFDTGDLGRFDEDGYLWLTGRAKDVIIRSGHNIDPSTIEEPLYRHPAVEMAAAVGRLDIYAGEIPVAFVQLKPGAAVDPAELQAFVRERIAERAAGPAAVYILPQMPLTAVGKIFKPALRQMAAKAAIEQALAAQTELQGQYVVEVAPHPKYGSLATVTCTTTLCPEEAEVVRALLGKFQIRSELR